MFSTSLTVDDEFRDLIPPLTDEEFNDLEESILADGLRDPIIVWLGHNIVVDGHNRLKICKKHGVEYDFVEMEFDSRAAVKVWILKNQLGRRNLNDYNRTKVRLQFKDAKAELSRQRLSEAGKKHRGNQYTMEPLQNFAKVPLCIGFLCASCRPR